MSTRGKPVKKSRGKTSRTSRTSRPKGVGIVNRFVSRSPSEVVPDNFRVQLTYFDQFPLNAGSTVPDNYVFRANSLFDPNLTGAGHQPLGYDQWTTFYSNWVVVRAAVKFTMTPPNLSISTPQIDNAIVAVTPRRNDASALSTVTNALEQPYTRWTMVSGYSRPPTLSLTVDCARFFGVFPTVYRSSLEYSGAIGANPTQVLHFVLTAGSTQAGTTDPDPIYVTAEFLFDCVFYNAITLAQS